MEEKAYSGKTLLFKSHSLALIEEDRAKFKVSKDISINDVQQRITIHLNTLFERFHLTPWEQDMHFVNLIIVFEALNFIKEVLFINKIVIQKAYALLGEYMADTKDIFDVFLKSYCHTVAKNHQKKIDKDIDRFLKVFFVKQPSILNKFLSQLFDICVKQNNPLKALEIGLNGNGSFKNCSKLQDYAYEWIQLYSRKSQVLQNSIFKFAQESRTLNTNDNIDTFECIKVATLNALKSNGVDLIYQLVYESLVFKSAIDMKNGYEMLFNFILLLNDKISENEHFFEDTNIYEIFNVLFNNSCTNTKEQKSTFIKNANELWLLLYDEHMQQTDKKQNVQITMVKKKILEMMLDGSIQPSNFQENVLMKAAIKPTWDKFGIDSQIGNEPFLKQYRYENLLLSSKLTTMVVETPFKDPYYKLYENDILQSNLHLKLNFYEYLILFSFGNDDIINFEVFKNRFYQNLNKCHPAVTHNDNNSRVLFKKCLKPFYKSSFIVSYSENNASKANKILKWSKLLIKWKDSFEKDDYTNFTLNLNLTKKLNIDKSQYIFDKSIKQYVCCL